MDENVFKVMLMLMLMCVQVCSVQMLRVEVKQVNRYLHSSIYLGKGMSE